MEISSNAVSLASDLARAARDLQPAVEASLDAAQEMVLEEVARLDQRTYDRPVPVGKKGRPKYTRTGNFKRSPRARKLGPGVRAVYREGPAAEEISGFPGGYAQKLGHIPVSKDGVNRANPSFDETSENLQDTLYERFLVTLQAEWEY